MGQTPADSLEDRDLGNGWKVIEKLHKGPFSTGGRFSVGYKVEKSGSQAYLKALDFSAASQAPDPARALQAMTEAFNFERDLLDKCKTQRLDRIITPLHDGSMIIPGFGDFSLVHYLIFEIASGDIRKVVSDWQAFDLRWCLKSLHNVAVGLRQLHAAGIAHQDLKPSNVLVMMNSDSKIGDLGRASDQTKESQNDHFPVPGDLGYAPLDLSYQDASGIDRFERRFLADIYLLGSLFFFYFTRVSATHLLRAKLQGTTLTNTSFSADLPHLQYAFEEALSHLREQVSSYAGALTEEIVLLAQQLCDPDPTKRGDPRWKESLVANYDLQTYISKLDRLYRRVEINLK